MKHRDKQKWQLLEEFSHGEWRVTRFMVTEPNGEVRELYTAQVGSEEHPNGYRFVVARDLEGLREQLGNVLQERPERQKIGTPKLPDTQQQKGDIWNTVSSVIGINDDGTAKLRVYKASKNAAELATQCTGSFIPYAFRNESQPKEGDTIDVHVGSRQASYVNDAVDQFRRRKERGQWHCMAEWTDATSSPVERQTLVKFTLGIDQGGYIDREATPVRGQRPEAQLERVYVVFRKSEPDPRVGLVVGVTNDRNEAVGMVKDFDQKHQQTQAKGQQQHQSLEQSNLPRLLP